MTEAVLDILGLGLGGENDDGDRGQFGVLFEFEKHHEAAFGGHHEIEEDEIGLEFADFFSDAGAIFEGFHEEAVVGKAHRKEAAVDPVVVHHEDAACRGGVELGIHRRKSKLVTQIGHGPYKLRKTAKCRYPNFMAADLQEFDKTEGPGGEWGPERAEALRLSEERFQLAVDGSGVGIWDWVLQPRPRIWWSDRFFQLLGRVPGSLQPTIAVYRQLLHREDVERTFGAFKALLADGVPFVVEHRLEVEGQGYRWFQARGSLLRKADGTPWRMTGSVTDIHELREAQERAQAAARAKSEFNAMVSHELRTPLNGILVGLEMIEPGLRGQPELEEMFQLVQHSAENLRDLINDILALSLLESGRMRLEPGRSRVDRLLEQLAASFKLGAREKGVEVEWSVMPGCPAEVETDLSQCRQILLQLLGNAVKFSRAGGRVRLIAGAVAGGIEFRVEDEGVGIPEELLERVFEPFFQVQPTTTREHGGVGLGLTLARRMTEALGGKLRLESRLGAGTTVRLELPQESEKGLK